MIDISTILALGSIATAIPTIMGLLIGYTIIGFVIGFSMWLTKGTKTETAIGLVMSSIITGTIAVSIVAGIAIAT